jgi:hypothetical protein
MQSIMRRLLRWFTIVLLIVLIALLWVWWNRPRTVDLTSYAPADSLVYLESNSLVDLATAVRHTNAWQKLAPYYGLKSDRWQDRWLNYIARATGIGSAQNVIASRAQVAFVMLDLTHNVSGETLEYKSHEALIVETHTSPSRMKPVIERYVGDLARRTYGQPKLERIQKDDREFLIWTSPDGARKLIVSFDGTVAIISNDEQSVRACLAAHGGQRPSLAHQPELEDMRVRMRSSEALAFGYVPSTKAPNLFVQTIPIFFVGMPEVLQALVTVSTPRIVGTIGWSAHAFEGGIEDDYFIALKPPLVPRLRPAFASSAMQRPDSWAFLPDDTHSVSNYNLNNPGAAWEALKAALASQVEFLTAAGLGKLEARAFESYGIDQPDTFLKSIKSEVLTARLDASSERAVVIARVADETALRQFVARRFGPKAITERIEKDELTTTADGHLSAAFAGNYFLLGPREELRRCLLARARQATPASSSADMKRVDHFSSATNEPAVVTYTRDDERARDFASTLSALGGHGPAPGNSPEMKRTLSALPHAETESRLVPEGLERRTWSPFGLFATLVSFLSSR